MRKLRLLGDEVFGGLEALSQPGAQPLLAAGVEQRRVAPALESAHGFVHLDRSQRRHVILKRRYQGLLLRHE